MNKIILVWARADVKCLIILYKQRSVLKIDYLFKQEVALANHQIHRIFYVHLVRSLGATTNTSCDVILKRLSDAIKKNKDR